MKYFPIKKKSSGARRKLFIPQGVRTSLPKPKFKRTVVWNTHPPDDPPTKAEFGLDRI